MSKIWEKWLWLVWKVSGGGVIGDLLAALVWAVRAYAIAIVLLVGVIMVDAADDGITAFGHFVVRAENVVDMAKQKVTDWLTWGEKPAKQSAEVRQLPKLQLHSSLRQAARYAPSILDIMLTWWWQIGGVLAFFPFSSRRSAARRFDRRD